MFDSCVPDVIDIQAEMANDSAEEYVNKLQKAFDLLEEHLGVSQLLEPQDLMVHRIDHKCVMTYVAAIKNAMVTHKQRMQEMEEAAKNESLKKKLNGDKLYEEGMSKKLTAQTDSDDALVDVTNNAKEKLEEPDLSQEEIDQIIQDAQEDLAQVTSRFDHAVEKFEAAKVEYEGVEDSDTSDQVLKCNDRIRECNEFVDNLRLNLKKQLDDLVLSLPSCYPSDDYPSDDLFAGCRPESP